MTEEKKPGEYYPLLKDGTEGGDHLVVIPTTGWSAQEIWQCPPKKSNRVKRHLKLPELFFAFWITLTVFIIGILLFYVFTSVYYDVKWTTIKTVSHCSRQLKTRNKVSLQYITGRGTDVPFSTFSEILSEMAIKYPKIAFEVQFYLSDAKNDFEKFKQGWMIMNQENQNNITAFVTKHRNVMVEFRTISELMNTTPLRYTWEYLSLRYLTFYAGIYEVWKSGAASMDLGILAKKSQYGKQEKFIEHILQSHNDGREVQYNDLVFEKQKDATEAELNLSFFFFDMFEQLVNDTREMLSVDHFSNQFRTDRFKRNYLETTNSQATDKVNEESVANKNITNEASYMDTSTSNTKITNSSNDAPKEKIITETSVKTTEASLPEMIPMKKMKEGVNMSAAVKPNRFFLLFTRNSAVPMWNQERSTKDHLYMNKDGSFVATEMKRNPFLSKILLTTGCPRLTPEYAIEKLYMEQCSSFEQCDTIHIF